MSPDLTPRGDRRLGAPDSAEMEARIDAVRDDRGRNSWTYHCRVSVDHRYVCMTVPKVASTTVKRALRELEGLPTAADDGELHQQGTFLALSTFSSADLAEMLTSSHWLRFGFVRNPYDRLFSAWKSKIAGTQDEYYGWHRDLIRSTYSYPAGKGTAPPPMVTFRDFVRFVVDTDDPQVRLDGHWNLQTSVLLHDLIAFDVLVRFERFVEEFTAVLRQLGAGDEVVALAARVSNPSPQLPLAAAYDRELADVVYRLYEPDFEAFGYARDSWLLTDP